MFFICRLLSFDEYFMAQEVFYEIQELAWAYTDHLLGTSVPCPSSKELKAGNGLVIKIAPLQLLLTCLNTKR